MAQDEPLEAQLQGAREGALQTWLLALLGRFGEHEEQLDEARRVSAEAASPSAELVAAMAMLEAGLPARATGALERAEVATPLGAAPADQAVALVIHAQLLLASGSLSTATEVVQAGVDIAASCAAPVQALSLLAAAEVALANDARLRARELADRVRNLGVGGLLRARATVLFARCGGPPAETTAELERAIGTLSALGASRDVGLAYMVMAELEATLPGGSPVSWLARAHPLLASSGTAADQHRLRAAFRIFGRRDIDRMMDQDMAGRVELLRHHRARLADVLAAQRDARNTVSHLAPLRTKTDERVDELLGLLQRAEEELIKSVEALVLQRERVTQLVSATKELGSLDDADKLLQAIPGPPLSLCRANAAQLFELNASGALRPLPQAGKPLDVLFDELARDAAQCLGDGRVRALTAHPAMDPDRAAGGPRWTVMVPLSQAGRIVLVIQRPTVRGGFSEWELEQLALYGSLAGASVARARSNTALREAAARDAATLAAFRDGVISLDGHGVVRAVNAAAAQLLRLDSQTLCGQVLANVAALAPVAEALSGSHAAQGEVVSLPTCDVLMRWQSYEGGLVATLQELSSAQKLAHRLVGSPARFRFDDLQGKSPELLDCVRDARRGAASDLPVLITGESGTGKEMLAQAIHNASPRAGQPFVGLNVAAIPRELLESELFGYERGAFTGAREGGKAGKFEVAERGTIVLDEIGDMPLEMQAKLLRILQERTIQRLGGNKEIPLRARVIATTHRDLERAVAEGAFRLDLFHRLRVLHLRLPPLRERRADIPSLVEHYLRRYAERVGRRPIHVAPTVLEGLMAHDWPGNVRELANLIEGEACLMPAEATTMERMLAPLARTRPLAAPVAPRAEGIPWPSRSGEILPFKEVEKRVVGHALQVLEGNVAAAAKALNLSKATLYNKINTYGLRPANAPRR
jgi:sigma-54 dependent transcriptional regulator, acetoin dehydrogenase operon transcriptional activator AcoR